MSIERPREVLFYLPSLGGGGAEMNAVRIAGCLEEYGFVPSFAVTAPGGSYETLLPPQTAVVQLPAGRIRSSTLRLVRSVRPLRRLVRSRSPAILCPVMDGPSLAALTALRRSAGNTRVVLSVQVSPKSEYLGGNFISRAHVPLMKKLYPRADHVIALSAGVAGELLEIVPELEGKISVVPNAAPGARALDRLREVKKPEGRRLIVACGRLVEQKGYPDLLRALSVLVRSEDAQLWILGDGPLRPELTSLAATLGVGDRVEFLGFRDHPEDYMRAADVFVLSSLWEGFGNVIVEAMSTGAPVVSTDCPHGPAEIIRDGENGILVPPADAQALATALQRVLGDEQLRRRLQQGALQRAADFEPREIARQFASVFSQVLAR